MKKKPRPVNYTHLKMLEHLGHEVELATYGETTDEINLECMDCNEVILTEAKS